MASSPATAAHVATPATIRCAEPSDIEAMRGVYAPYVATPVTFDVAVPTASQFAARMDEVLPAYPCLVLEHDARVRGFAYAHAQAVRAAYRWNAELSVYVEPEATGRGRGRTLYKAVLQLLCMQGFKNAYGLVTVPNAASERLHESLGFERVWVQRRAGWKDGAWHDVAWYAKALAPFDAQPADPAPFDELARTWTSAVREVLDRANAALTQRS